MADAPNTESQSANGGGSGGQQKGGGGGRRSGGSRDICVLEFSAPYNRVVTINALRQRCRGAFSLRTLAARPEGAVNYVGQGMSQMPDIPGLHIALDFENKRYRIFDPLERNKALLKQINAVIRSVPSVVQSAEVSPVEEVRGELNDDQWKSLILELKKKVDDEPSYAIVRDGKMPTDEEIAKMKGRRLADPWNNGRKPMYADQMDDYARQLDAV